MKRFAAIVVIGLALFLSAACASATPEPAVITIDMTEYAFTPQTLEFKVGQEVTLNLVNSGALDHELMIGRDVMMMDNHPNGYQVDFFENAGVEPTVEMGAMGMGEHDDEMEHSGFMVLVPEDGGMATIKFTVTKDMVGEWEMGCFELDGVHYTSGMVGTVVVEP